jgi:signal transduction histidine kinase
MTEPVNRAEQVNRAEPAGFGDRAPREMWSLRRRVTALCLLAAVMLTFLAAGAASAALANQGQLDRLLDQIGPMRTASTTLLTDLVNQETAIRGYALNQSPDNLAVYRAAGADEDVQVKAIGDSPSTTPEITADLVTVTSLADRWRSTVAEPVIAAVQAGDKGGATALLGADSRAAFDRVREAVATMQNAMQAVRDDSVASVRDTSSTLLFVLIVAVVIMLAGGVGLLIALQRLVIGPVTDLAAQVRSVARGRYDHDITTDGPPELARLASDVDSMRRQIASDLAEVEAARRQIEEANVQLESQAEELLRSNRDLEQFAYVASHDLQEPLRKVASFCQLLQRRYAGQLDERADQYIAFAVSGAQRMQRLINDLLAFSRIGRTTSGFAEVDLDRVVADAVGQLEPTLEAAGAEVIWSDLPVVRGEEQLLSTLVNNLIANAVKFRRPDVPPRVHLSCRQDADAYEISCVDNGIGIESEFADKVFVIFQRLHPRDAYPGTGIGLAIAKKIIEFHGGTIRVDTAHTGGAAIRFTLPVSAEPVAVPGAAPPLASTVEELEPAR